MRYEVADGVAWLTINRPEARNALNKAVRDGLWAGVRRFNADRRARRCSSSPAPGRRRSAPAAT